MSKKLFISAIIFLYSFKLFAQVGKGQIYGDASFGKRVVKYNTNSFQPSFSIGLNEHSTLGVFYNYTRSETTPSIYSTGYFTNQGIGVSYNYFHYFKNSKKWGWYVNGALTFNRVSIYDKSTGSSLLNNRYSQRELAVTPGIFFKPSHRVMLFANIGGVSLINNKYEFLKLRSSFASQFNIGIRINIGGRRN